MKAPLKCVCGHVLETILNRETAPPEYTWKPEQAMYVLTYEGAANMECPECGRDLSRDLPFDVPDELSLSIQDTTDPVEAEEVNVNGTVYSNVEIDSDDWYLKYIQVHFHALLEKWFGELEVNLLERGESEAGRYFQDFCIELKDGSELEMEDIIKWWRAARGSIMVEL